MTGRWVMDRPDAKGLCPVVLSDGAEESHRVTGRWQGPVKHDRTRPVKENHFWNLTGDDRMLEAERPVSCSRASGQQMTVEIRQPLLKAERHVADIE